MTTLFTPKNNSTHKKPVFFQGFLTGIALIQEGIGYLFSTQGTSRRPPEFAEIETLVELLAEEQGVESVKAIAHKPNSLHEITFVLVSDVSLPQQKSIREKAIDSVTQVEWKLSDLTQTENWYFDAKVTRKFDNNLVPGWLVTSSNGKSQRLSAAS